VWNGQPVVFVCDTRSDVKVTKNNQQSTINKKCNAILGRDNAKKNRNHDTDKQALLVLLKNMTDAERKE